MKKILSLLLLTSALSGVTFSMSGGDEVPKDLGGLANSMVNSSHVNSFLSRAARGNTLNSEQINQLKNLYTQLKKNPAVQNSDAIEFEDDSLSYEPNGKNLLGIIGIDFTKKNISIAAVKRAIFARPGLETVAGEFNIPTNTLVSIGTYLFFENENKFKEFLRLLEHFERSRGSELSVGLSSSELPEARLPLASYSMSSSVVEPFIAEWRNFASAIGITRIAGNKETLHAFIREKLIEENAARVGAFTQEKLADIINKILLNSEAKYPTDGVKIQGLDRLYRIIIAKKLLDVPASSLPENITCSDPLNNPRIIDDSTVPGTGGNTFLPIQNLKHSSRSSSPIKNPMVSDEEFVSTFNFEQFRSKYRTLRSADVIDPEQFLRIALNLDGSTDFLTDLRKRVHALSDAKMLPFSIVKLFWEVISSPRDLDSRVIAEIGDTMERVDVDSYGNAIIPSDSPLVTSSGDMRRSPSPLDLSSSISSLPLSPSSDLSSSGGMGGGDLKPVDLSSSVISSSSPGLSSSITASSGGMGGKLSPVGLPSSTSSLSRSPSVVAPVTEFDVAAYLKNVGASPRELAGLSVQIARIVREKPQLLSDVNEQEYFEKMYRNSNNRMTSTLNSYLK